MYTHVYICAYKGEHHPTPAALSGPVADKGLRRWVYQAQAYERTGHLGIRAGFSPPPKKKN